MKIFERLEDIPSSFAPAVVTIGNFDGVHKGHQELLRQTVSMAKEMGGTSVAVTFNPHPMRVLPGAPTPPLITLHPQKCELIEKSGIDVLVSIPFTMDFAGIEPHTFVKTILVDTIGARTLVVGPDYNFGKARKGDVEALKAMGETLGFEVTIPKWVSVIEGEKRISSTRIRDLVEAGDMETARALLGRHYQVRGQVVTGRNRGGKLLGFPTANILLQDELCPKRGVYAVSVECAGEKYKGVANIGYSPTFGDHQFTVEVHILDFTGDIYGKVIRVNFISRLRDEKKFDGIESLTRQILIDTENAREVLKRKLSAA